MKHSLRSQIAMYKDMGKRELACPKPRHAIVRVSSGEVEMYKPMRKLTSCNSLPAEGDAGQEILDILFEKASLVDPGSPSPFLFGSPPRRASNPLIHDVHFMQKKVTPSQLHSPQKFSCRPGGNSSYKKSSCGASCGSTPFVRIEGFGSPTSSDTRGVSAFA